MSTKSPLVQKAAALMLSAMLAGVALTASTGAEAFTPKMPHGMAGKFDPMRAGAMARAKMRGLNGPGLLKRGLGFGAAALAGGLALGALVPTLAPECSLAERPAVDDMGNTYYERVRVCE